METVVFITKIFNECASINTLLYSKSLYAKEFRALLSEVFGITILQQIPKFGICAKYKVKYDLVSSEIKEVDINSVDLYTCRFKLQVKEKNGIEYINNILNDPIIQILEYEKMQKISNYLFHDTNLPRFIIDEVDRDIEMVRRSNYAFR